MNSTPTDIQQRNSRRKIWNDPKFRAVIYQIVALLLVAAGIWYLVSNTLHNLSVRNIATGFGFLSREAGFAISESLISFTPADTYERALTVGLLNTLRAAVVGIVLATILGTIVGIARLSKNWLVAKLSAVYVEVMRNIPLLLQLFFWYALISESLPGPRQAFNPMPGVFLSNRGLKVPLIEGDAISWILGGLFVAIVLSVIWANIARRKQEKTGKIVPVFKPALALLVICPVLGWLVSGADLSISVPVLKGFNFQGGLTVTPEFTALIVGLVTYTSAFIAEVVRSGIQAVNKGQWEAASALGLRRRLILRLVILPQALRVIIPPMTSQYLNLTKNSSLAVAIGYPDIVSVVNTTLNQTGQAIEGILIIMLAYLTVSLSISVFMNWYNKHIALVER